MSFLSSIALAWETCSGVMCFNTSNSPSGSPPKAPIAAAIGKPTMPVPGTATPNPFFIKFGDTLASIRSGVLPKYLAAVAAESAKEIGSVQPSAGTTSRSTI